MNLTGYYSEDVLNTMLENGNISHLEYLFHHSPEKKEEFENFCREKGLTMDEKAAGAFFKNWMETVAEDYNIDGEREINDDEYVSSEQ